MNKKGLIQFRFVELFTGKNIPNLYHVIKSEKGSTIASGMTNSSGLTVVISRDVGDTLYVYVKNIITGELKEKVRHTIIYKKEIVRVISPKILFDNIILAKSTDSAGNYRYSTHKVKKGENLSLISKKYGCEVNDLLNVNKLPNPDNIAIGQIIKIPYKNKNQKSDESNHRSNIKLPEKNISQPESQKRIESKDISDEYTKETGKPMKVAQDATSPCICKQYDLAWGGKVSCDFRKRVIEISKKLWPNDSINMASQLMAVMHLETAGTFSPKIGTFISKKLTDDAKGGYVGLIQFGQYAAIDLKVKRSELSQMTAVKQLDYVEKYYQLSSANTKIKNLTGLYLWVNYPKNVKENRLDDEDIVYAAPKDAEVTSEKFLNSPYHQNPSFMKEDGEYVRKGKEVITQGVKNGSTKVWEVQREIEKHFNNGNKQENKAGNFTCAYEQVKQHSSKTIDIDIFAKTLRSRAEPASIGKCAKYVRIALEAAGANTTGHPVPASDWGPTLIKNGYKEISEVFNQPIKGDIYIITKTSTHKYGHIAGYDGSQWISDFKQKSQVIYRDKVDYRYFRIQ
ncbi:peptidoglycan-binding protein LysM [Acinetobacter proteolyticus]|uniref:LysM peptidoglycan-binding domain-containing protein n=1 Tax=Acinetobacter proteolyticus TaxID=1776741 RepID=UPI0008632383|nr:LysM peptidoglycan-binding domain-containing protein [Acinetobacter proteolyticus]OEY96744.1 peptidoglycan-binding protein LysM [Acinetobacter proteolyticus]